MKTLPSNVDTLTVIDKSNGLTRLQLSLDNRIVNTHQSSGDTQNTEASRYTAFGILREMGIVQIIITDHAGQPKKYTKEKLNLSNLSMVNETYNQDYIEFNA